MQPSRARFFLLSLLLTSWSAYAVCTLCTVAVGAGIGLSRWFGIDDTIVSLWIGGLVVSLIMWNLFWFDKKNIKFPGRNVLTIIVYYAVIMIPLFYTDILNHPLNQLWGIDKIILGVTLGSLLFWAGGTWYFYLKRHNNNRAYFLFQKVVMPVTPLIILSLVFYLIKLRV